MSAKKIFRIVPAGATDWKVVSDSRVHSSHREKDEAVAAGVHLARKAGNGLVIIPRSEVYTSQK